ncbi:unnamed protein product, partial [Mesorhabditis belari]|uniref:Trehalase n=1 Tax=Mesorhabditis belari TaxID=2138241 RepID=A0AAF3F9G7_9BILA
MKISALLLFLSLLQQCHSAKHIGLFGLDIGEEFHGQEVIDKPWNVTCTIPICEGPLAGIYCSGPIIESTWRFGLQEYCPGPVLKYEPEQVLGNFNALSFPMKKETFAKFCDDNFDKKQYLELTSLPDYVENATFLPRIRDPEMRTFAKLVHTRWSTLARRFVPDMRHLTTRLPVLVVPNPFIVPGGFFQVYFYWDSYWIIKGLLVSNMTLTVKGMLMNFGFIIDNHGFIPNSGNIQLSRRSQPPLFVQMLADYFYATKDTEFLQTMMPTVEKEMQFWRKNRTVNVLDKNGRNRTMFQYRVITNCPRPENFLVDVENGINGSYDPQEIWSSTASACESGWDFSSRWFDHNGSKAFTKYSIRTNTILPVDLNSFIGWNFRVLSNLYKQLGDEKNSQRYKKEYEEMLESLEILWNEDAGIWQDLDLKTREFRNDFYPSNVFPLLVTQYNQNRTDKLRKYLKENRVLEYPGGVPSTLKVSSTQQWDFPNVWAPNVHLFVECLLNSGDLWLVKQARDLAKRFVITVKNGLVNPKANVTATIWEKYDARFSDGTRGEGGEYYVQEGFGWTNGVMLDLINKLFINSTLDEKEQSSSEIFEEMRMMEFFRDGFHTWIILGVLVFLMLIIFWFLIFGIISSKLCSLGSRPTRDRASSQRLLDEDLEDFE